jgi:hypothetical protein
VDNSQGCKKGSDQKREVHSPGIRLLQQKLELARGRARPEEQHHSMSAAATTATTTLLRSFATFRSPTPTCCSPMPLLCAFTILATHAALLVDAVCRTGFSAAGAHNSICCHCNNWV